VVDIELETSYQSFQGKLKQTNIPLLSLMETANISTNPHPEKYRKRLSVQLLCGKQHPILQHAPLNWTAGRL
jgi:hypothetical protein